MSTIAQTTPEAPAGGATTFCPSCGAVVGSSDQFCGSCGTRVQGPGETSVETAPGDTQAGRQAPRFLLRVSSATRVVPNGASGDLYADM
jgi:hypothetical protein